MTKTARVIFVIIGIIFPVLIGALHTFTHFNELTSSKVQQLLTTSISINGQEQTLWNTWGIMSFMMGIAFIIIGLLNYSIYKRLQKNELPPISTLSIMAIYLMCVIYAGIQFEQTPQLYGGIVGLLLAMVCIFLSFKGANPNQQKS